MRTFKSLNEEPARLLNTGLSTFSPSSKCATSYFETQRPRIDYLAGLTNFLPAVMNKLQSQSYPSHRKGKRITFLFNGSILCFADPSVAEESKSSPKSTSVFLSMCSSPQLPFPQLSHMFESSISWEVP